jgi:hypothetical protein
MFVKQNKKNTSFLVIKYHNILKVDDENLIHMTQSAIFKKKDGNNVVTRIIAAVRVLYIICVLLDIFMSSFVKQLF